VAVNVKQKFLRSVYPQLVVRVLTDGDYLTTEEAWDAEAAAQEGSCVRYALTDTHIILPCHRHYWAAAQPGVAGKGVGDWQADAFQGHKFTIDPTKGTIGTNGSDYGAVTVGPGGSAARDRVDFLSNYPISDGVNGAPRIADETRPKTSYLLPCIKVADVAVNASQVDMLALAGLVAELNGNKVDWDAWAQKLHEPTGYQVFPGGLILQWGRTGIINSTAYATVTFPTAFPNAAWIVLGCAIGDDATDAAGNNGGCCTYIIDQSQFTIGHYNAGSNHTRMFWIAVGN